ncbi:MAG: hypothetical protein KME20_03890 [Kaiparowitsia implicata GSE-PSE-MK54-09C]|jgi:hypothetical protein|nr:hypothetical protein [Kaiparowitsia implicata GSE-PSE-MK54-09C]
MAFFRQYIAPLFVVLIFALALIAVSARIFLPEDMAAPAPVETPDALSRGLDQDLTHPQLSLDQLVRGVPLDLGEGLPL